MEKTLKHTLSEGVVFNEEILRAAEEGKLIFSWVQLVLVLWVFKAEMI